MNVEELAKKVYSPEDTEEYKQFVEKHKPKRTTDDCYTPREVYEVIKAWVLEQCPQIHGLKIVRPFYPGGDYQAEDYTGAVVIDNPPFSILSEIKRFYLERQIPFFLFAPSLTLFSGSTDCNHIIADCKIRYQNGALVRTSFVSNLFGDDVIILTSELSEIIDAAQRKEQEQKTKPLPKYDYPPNVVSAARLQKFIRLGVNFRIKRDEARFIRALDHQREYKKGIYGSGFLISDHAAEALRAEALQKERAGRERVVLDIVWTLSERERAIIEELNKRG